MRHGMPEERRANLLTDQDLHAVAEIIARTRPIADEIHMEHHQFISEWIVRSRRRAEMFDKIRTQVGGWGVIAVLSGIGYAVWEWVRTHLR